MTTPLILKYLSKHSDEKVPVTLFLNGNDISGLIAILIDDDIRKQHPEIKDGDDSLRRAMQPTDTLIVFSVGKDMEGNAGPSICYVAASAIIGFTAFTPTAEELAIMFAGIDLVNGKVPTKEVARGALSEDDLAKLGLS
jgi:hypothetical protein